MSAQIRAAGRVSNGATGAGAARGAVVARTGAGVYTITLDTPIPAGDCGVLVTVEGTNTAAKVAHTSDAVKTVSIVALAAGQAATDSEFSFAVLKYDFYP